MTCEFSLISFHIYQKQKPESQLNSKNYIEHLSRFHFISLQANHGLQRIANYRRRLAHSFNRNSNRNRKRKQKQKQIINELYDISEQSDKNGYTKQGIYNILKRVLYITLLRGIFLHPLYTMHAKEKKKKNANLQKFKSQLKSSQLPLSVRPQERRVKVT